MTHSVAELMHFLEQFASLELAEDWDNVGLLVGDPNAEARRVMTCLTLTEDVAEEAIDQSVDFIISHHPLLFRPVQRLTTSTAEGRVLLKLLAHETAVYSPHTAFDSAPTGINQQLAEALGLSSIKPIRARDRSTNLTGLGSGRYGILPQTIPLTEFLQLVKKALSIPMLQYVGDPQRDILTVGVACGSAAEFLSDACALGCDVLLTGEARFHALLEARSCETALVLAGHYATERPAVEQLADTVAAEFQSLQVWASRVESDPMNWSVH